MGVKCRRRAAVEVLWLMGHAVDGGGGQPGSELVPGGSCDVHSCIEGASGDGRRVSWFAPQNQGGGRRSEEHTSELQSLGYISYAVFCLDRKSVV